MKKKMKQIVLTLGIIAFLAGCATVLQTAVLLSDAEDAAMKEWARAHNDHMTTADLDLKVMAAHARFNEAKAVAVAALKAYQAGGDKGQYVAALEATRAVVGSLIEILMPVLSPQKVQALKTNLSLATQP